MNHCIKCESQVEYQKYCDGCVELYGLQDKQDIEFRKEQEPIRKADLEQIFRDDMAGKTSSISGVIRKFKKISETVPLNTLYKVKGHPGLWFPKGKPAKNNMLRMLKYGSNEAATLATTVDHTKDLQGPLVGWYVQALDNCQAHFNNEVADIPFQMGGADTIGLREIIRPGYDETKFERKDLRQLLEFYNAIVSGSKVDTAKLKDVPKETTLDYICNDCTTKISEEESNKYNGLCEICHDIREEVKMDEV